MSVTRVQLVGNVSTGASFAGIITATSFSGDGSGLTGVGIGSTGNINTSGIITASAFVGDGSGLTGVGVGTEDSINTTGIITASTISANEFIGTGDKLIFSPSPTSFSPIDGATDIDIDTNINITFDQPIYAGVGTITLRYSSGIGTIIESIGVGSTPVSISNQTLTINPSDLLPLNNDIYVVVPQGAVVNAVDGVATTISNYNFTTVDFSLVSTNPSSGATGIGGTTNIVLTFSGPPSKGTGIIEIRYGSASGGIGLTFDAATSPDISIVGNDWILNPSGSIGYGTDVYPIIPNQAIQNFAGLNTTGGASYFFSTVPVELGDPIEGGYLICCSASTYWILAPQSAEVGVTCFDVNCAVTCAQTVTGCTGWFVPCLSQLQNPGYCCSVYWDSINGGGWYRALGALAGGNLCTGYFRGGLPYDANNVWCTRAFRCVSY